MAEKTFKIARPSEVFLCCPGSSEKMPFVTLVPATNQRITWNAEHKIMRMTGALVALVPSILAQSQDVRECVRLADLAKARKVSVKGLEPLVARLDGVSSFAKEIPPDKDDAKPKKEKWVVCPAHARRAGLGRLLDAAEAAAETNEKGAA